MRLRRRYVLAAAMLGVLAGTLSVALGVEPTPTVQAVNVGGGHAWSPTQVSVAPGGEVTISNHTSIPHGVEWVSGPKTPVCDSDVPTSTSVSTSGKEWSGSCKFTEPGTYVFYCTVHGAEMTATVTVASPGAPTATTGSATSVGQTGATLQGTVNAEKKATTYQFEYGTSTAYGQKTPETSAGEGEADEPVSANLSALASGTTYHYRLVAKNGSGTTPGSDRTFTTEAAPGAPSVSTGTASGITETAATLGGTVNPDGKSTEYQFEWGTSEAYGHTTGLKAVAGEDHVAHSESAALSGLTPGVVYHYRVVATNSSGPAQGLDRTFTTLSAPPPVKEETPTTTTPTTTVTTPTATVPTSSTPPPPSSTKGPVAVASLTALQVSAPRHATSVRVSVQVAGAGRLRLELLAKSSALGKTRSSKPVVVGSATRTTASAGKLSLSVSLNARAKQALKHRHSLKVSVELLLTPKSGAAASAAKSVTLRL